MAPGFRLSDSTATNLPVYADVDALSGYTHFVLTEEPEMPVTIEDRYRNSARNVRKGFRQPRTGKHANGRK